MEKKPDHEELFELLNSEKVRYLVVGAHAVGFYSEPRATGDIDIFVPTDPAIADRLVKVIDKFGFSGLGITRDDFLIPDRIIQLGYPPLRIDFITGIDGVQFSDAWRSRERGLFGGVSVWYISKENLIKNKREVGRPKDKIDLLLLKRRAVVRKSHKRKS